MNQLIESLMSTAIKRKASDVYFLPYKDDYLIKIHGVQKIENYRRLTYEQVKIIINYFKYNGHMQISEHRRPLTGALKWHFNGNNYYLRLSTVANYNGKESLVIRIIYSFNQITTNYLVKDQFDILKKLSMQRGLMIFSGPTGSGKTTTIYHLAKQFQKDQLIMSIEDPVEIHEDDFLQLQVNSEAGMNYQELLKVGLRNRPDIFIIGEIRDKVTANVAVQAALSGHLVFSTVHAKDPLGVVERLMQLGISEHYLKSSLNSIGYQRLIPEINGNLLTLFSIVTNKQIFQKNVTEDELLIKWRKNLRNGVVNGKITEKEQTKFYFG